jgi:hypothetical protein
MLRGAIAGSPPHAARIVLCHRRRQERRLPLCGRPRRETGPAGSAVPRRFAQPCTPANSIVSKGSLPITGALCQGESSNASPARRVRRAAASIGFDLYCASEDNALVMMRAAGRAGHRFMCSAQLHPRLVEEAGDIRLAEKRDLDGHERKHLELIRLVESLRLEARHVFRLYGSVTRRGPCNRSSSSHRSARWSLQAGQ